MTRLEALGYLTRLLVAGFSLLGGTLLFISSFYFFIGFGWFLLALDPDSPFDDGLFGRTLLRLLGATIGAAIAITLIIYGRLEFKRINARAAQHLS